MTNALKLLLSSLLIISFASGSGLELYFQDADLTQQLQPSSAAPLIVPSGNVLRCRLEEGVRIGKPGTRVSAVLAEPLYVEETLAVPQGARISGHIAFIETVPLSGRIRCLIGGDFTPPKIARVTFDQIVLSDGITVPIRTDATAGSSRVQRAIYAPNTPRPGFRQVLGAVVAPVRERCRCVSGLGDQRRRVGQRARNASDEDGRRDRLAHFATDRP